MPLPNLAALLATFRAAAEADHAAGCTFSDDTVATERARSLAFEALVHSVTCPTCGATTSGCPGRTAFEEPLWSLDHTLPMHQARGDLVNRLARQTDGGEPVVVRREIRF